MNPNPQTPAVSSILLTGHKEEKQAARELLADGYDPLWRSSRHAWLPQTLKQTPMRALDRKVKHGADLTFNEAFCGMCYVLAATNNAFRSAHAELLAEACGGPLTQERAVALAAAFLNLMAAKESFSRLTAEEIAGMTAAAMMDCVVQIDMGRAVETCGMGGDKGYGDGASAKKSINASTLSSLVLAALGLPSIKHGSYSNTSAVGSTEAIEHFGARTSMRSVEEVLRILKAAGYCFFDAHWCKTIHDLSHLLMMETVNHVIGPMTPPLTPTTQINKLMGVNEKVHPETIARAYMRLHQEGIQSVGGVVVVAGLSEDGKDIDPNDLAAVRRHTILDEFSPFASVVSVSQGSEFLGTFMMTPEDFGVTIDPELIKVDNTQSAIRCANIEALHGTNQALSDYLAMNAALGLFAHEYARRDDAVVDGRLNRSHLRECFLRCGNAIRTGQAGEILANYVKVSKGEPELATT